MSKRYLNGEFSIDALWTVNDVDSEYGMLKYNRGEIIVDFPHSELEFGSTFTKLKGINNKVLITLFNVNITKATDKELSMVRAHAEYMVIDKKYVESLDSFKLSSISWTTDRLPLFLREGVWKRLENGKGFEYSKPNKKEYEIESLKAKVSIGFSGDRGSKITSEEGFVYTFKSNPRLTISYEEEKNILDIKKDIEKIDYLITILTGSPQLITSYNYTYSKLGMFDKKIPVRGEFYFNQNFPSRKNHQPSTRSAYEFDTLSKNFGEILSRYFKNYNQLENIIIHINLMTSVKNILESSYIDVVTSLEGFHREFYHFEKDIYETTEDVISKIEDFVKESSEDKTNKEKKELEKITYSLKNVRNLTLRDRIADLLKKLPETLKSDLIFEGTDFCKDRHINKFSDRIAAHRNYLAHGSNKENPQLFESYEMLAATYILTIVGEYFLMDTIGIEEDIIIDGIKNKKIYQNHLEILYDSNR